MPINQSDVLLGILGGGQLGRMLIQKAMDWDIQTLVVDGEADAPCRYLTRHFIHRPYNDKDAVLAAGRQCTHLTIEIEHVSTEALEQLQKEGIAVFPSAAILSVIQDKGKQKEFFLKSQIATAPFFLVTDRSDLKSKELKYPFVLKLCKTGYDGRGVMKIESDKDLENAFDSPSVVEEWIDIEKEISVIAARNRQGQIALYPPVEMVFNPKANLLDYLIAPARLTQEEQHRAKALAAQVVESFQLTGLMAVEMFLTRQGDLLVNECAPRPHNSGHHTIESSITSQYEQLLRVIFNLPPGNTRLHSPAVMINLLGEEGYHGPAVYKGLNEALNTEGVYVHLYGKKMTRPFRKMGHVTILANTVEEALAKAQYLKSVIKVIA
jgi:5-(carboxyamino)imidazole ribonucleotide synthase